MPSEDVQLVLKAYDDDCRPSDITPIESAGGFSGSRLWRLATGRGPLCLRRWPKEHPSVSRLQFIQAVLWHVWQEGFRLVPLPLETRTHAGYVEHGGYLWELAPWMPGAANWHARRTTAMLDSAMLALARFHLAAAPFPLPDEGPAAPPGLADRREKLAMLAAGKLEAIRAAIRPTAWPELAERTARALALAQQALPRVNEIVQSASQARVEIQPCIRDIWHEHVLFVSDEVTGIVDFGSLRPDSVACDLARLLGSFWGDDEKGWADGLAMYRKHRRLTPDELLLVTAYDRTSVLISPIQWLEWIYLEGRTFERREAVIERLDLLLPRLAQLATS